MLKKTSLLPSCHFPAIIVIHFLESVGHFGYKGVSKIAHVVDSLLHVIGLMCVDHEERLISHAAGVSSHEQTQHELSELKTDQARR